MKQLDNIIGNILGNLNFLAPWLLRLCLGAAFALYGYGKFPLPPEFLVNSGIPIFLANLVAISEVFAGLILIIGGFFNDHLGNLLTRLGGLMIVVIMICAFYIAHQDWFITVKLFKNVQIFLLLTGLYFLIRGNH